MRHDPAVQQVVHTYQLGLPRAPVAGRTGELLGRGTGSSIEFQEYRDYQPGDDIRHLDWAAYARSDSLMVRLYREEISPRTEILLDASRSMATGSGAKSLVARQLAAAFALLAGQLGGRPNLWPLDDARPLRPLGIETLDALRDFPFAAVRTLPELLAEHLVPLGRQSVRIVISDFLFPHDPEPLVRRLATDASTLWVIQILTAWEADPSPLGGRRLVDVETGQQADLLLDRRAIERYRERLLRLQEELGRSCRRVHAPFVTLVADRGLAPLCRNDLCAAGLLRPA